MKIRQISTYIKRGITPSYVKQNGIPVVNQKCIKNGLINKEYIKLTRVDKNYTKGKRLQKGDILINSTGFGTLGRVAYVDNNYYAYADSHVTILRIDGYDQKFLYYYLRNIEKYVETLGKGSTNQIELSTDAISDICIPGFPINKQLRIADILSAYDDLIENNQRQIKLLEEAAQRLYKEWFVDLHFPGWENTQIVNGLPDGWEKYTFAEKVDIMSGGTPKTDVPKYYEGNIPFYSPKDSDGSFFAFDTQTHISQEGLDSCNSKYYEEGTIIITARGTVGKTTILAKPMAMNQSCYALKCNSLDAPYYLFFSLNQEVAALKGMANGGVFDTIIVKTFERIYIAFPNSNLIQKFEKYVKPYMEEIKLKIEMTSLLAEARDRLLSKMMSGKIEL